MSFKEQRERRKEIENRYDNTTVETVVDRICWWMLKLVGQNVRKNKIHAQS